ncbi:transglutaminase [Clostridium novyi A str. 4552]|uniref:Transglutaminase n=2 Tax=Clostridium novyi TaxID=1542 RepID=A0A0A0I5P3_CLONO|nr:transglutaminase [Clostridium novyi A str. 4552]
MCMKFTLKKGILMFLVCVLLEISFGSIRVFATDNTYKLLIYSEKVDINKEWKINFNKILDKSTLQNNIKVLEKDSGKEFPVKIQYNVKDKFVILKPVYKLKFNSEYSIVIKDGIKSSEGRRLLRGVRFKFKTKTLDNHSNKDLNGDSLLKEDFEDPGNNINNKEDFYNALRYSMATFKSNITLNINNYNSKDYSLYIINDILRENPIIDYGYKGVSGNIGISGNKAIMNVEFEYFYSKEKMEYMKKKAKEKTNYIIKRVIKENMSDYEKELAIHDYLVNNSTYDKRLFTGNIPQESYTDYGILVNGVGVCEGYAKAMYRILNSIGIETIFVTGKGISKDGSAEPHAWNIVKINGGYYQVDVTWDNPITPSGNKELRYDYFNITDSKMKKDHIWDTLLYPRCNRENYNFKKFVA